jgi:outer membrane lipoprotein SlyB
MRTRTILPASALVLAAGFVALAACGDRFSPDTYATRAVQQADKVEQGIIVGVRQVRISADGTTGAATGAAAGAVVGAQAPGSGIVSALGGVGGALVGGLIGQGAEHTIVDTNAYEYIVRTTKNELMRVTQQEREPLRRGQKVLLITGAQARVVADYTLPPEEGGTGSAAASGAAQAPAAGPPPVAGTAAATPAPTTPHNAGPLAPGVPAYPSVPPAPPAPTPPDAQATPGVDTAVTGG